MSKVKYKLIRDIDGKFRLFRKISGLFRRWKQFDYFYSEEGAREALNALKTHPRELLEETDWLEI